MAPTLALEHDFLMDTVLALSALHMSRLDEGDRGLAQASRMYFDRAVEGQVRALQTVDNQSGADALFVASTLISIHALVLTVLGRADERGVGPQHSLVDWAQIASASRTINGKIQSLITDPGGSLLVIMIHQSPNVMDDVSAQTRDTEDWLTCSRSPISTPRTEKVSRTSLHGAQNSRPCPAKNVTRTKNHSATSAGFISLLSTTKTRQWAHADSFSPYSPVHLQILQPWPWREDLERWSSLLMHLLP